MVLIQIILILLLVAVGIGFIGSRRRASTKAAKKLLLLLLIPAAIFVVLFPETTNGLAHLVGVGRGADLLLYALTVLVIFQLFDSYIKSRDEQRQIVRIVRKLAISEALHAKDKKRSK